MDEHISLQLEAFALRHDGTRCVDDGEAACVLLVDERWVINFQDDVESGRLHAFANVGQVRSLEPWGSDTAEWVTRTRTVDGFTWTAACDAQSGGMAITASLPRHSAADDMEAWLARVLERTRQVGSALSPDPFRDGTAGVPKPTLPPTPQSPGWLKA